MLPFFSNALTSILGCDSSDEKVVLILVGLVGSGKSTFAQALQEHIPHYRRCSQDDLGSRRDVEALARQSLAQGFSVCIDRTNFNESQRRHWIEIAREFPGTSIWLIVFDTPYEECATRLRERTSHPTIANPEQGLEILSRFASEYVPPKSYEGYDRCLSLKPDQTPREYSRADIEQILEMVRTSEALQQPASELSRSDSWKNSGHPPGYSAYPNYGHQSLRGRGNYTGGVRGRRGSGYANN